MAEKPFPDISGLYFELIPGFDDRYALSSDGRVWDGGRKHGWRPVRAFCVRNKLETVYRLHFGSGYSTLTLDEIRRRCRHGG